MGTTINHYGGYVDNNDNFSYILSNIERTYEMKYAQIYNVVNKVLDDYNKANDNIIILRNKISKLEDKLNNISIWDIIFKKRKKNEL